MTTTNNRHMYQVHLLAQIHLPGEARAMVQLDEDLIVVDEDHAQVDDALIEAWARHRAVEALRRDRGLDATEDMVQVFRLTWEPA